MSSKIIAKTCSSCGADLVSDPSLGFKKVNILCIECDFTPDAVKKFYEVTIPKPPEWALREMEELAFDPPKDPTVFESKEEMNPYLANAFALVGEDEMALRDRLFSTASKFGMLMTIARRRYVFKYAWAIPCKAALEAILEQGPIVEIGAGNGYWAHLLSKMGCDIVAYDEIAEDRYSKDSVRLNYRWFDVKKGDETSAALHSDRALLLCWTPYGSDMGLNCLKNYSGDTVICVGEDRGCTANEEFFDYLEQHFSQVDYVEIPVWWGLHDRLKVFKRNKE